MTAQDEPKKKGLEKFTKEVVYSALVSATAKAFLYAAIALVLLAVALVALGWQVPAWTLVAMMIAALSLIYLTRRASGREARETKEELSTAEGRLDDAEGTLDRHDSYGTNICSIMDNFQRLLAGELTGVSVPGFVERGILSAGRDVMQENGHAADLRMSVLLADGDQFKMYWASGHNLHSQKKYEQPIAKTVARIAYEKKVFQVWKDVTEEERGFHKNPHATRGFRAMVSIPILVGDRAVGVFNVVTERADAFDEADVNYLTSLGAVVQTAVGVAMKDIKREAEEEKRKAAAKPSPAAIVKPTKEKPLRRLAPKPAPPPGVGSGGSSTEGKEAPDD